MSATALVLHRVSDYDTWRKAYDSADGVRQQAGVSDAQVLRSTNGDNLVAITHDFDSPEAAEAFFSNEELKGAMERGGVDIDSFQLHILQRD